MNVLTPFLPTWVASQRTSPTRCCWLASDESKHVMAQAISVDQGMTQY